VRSLVSQSDDCPSHRVAKMTHSKLFRFSALSSSLTPSPSRDKPVTVADVRRLNQQSGACCVLVRPEHSTVNGLFRYFGRRM
jgi:hypothetical protein